MLWLIFAPFKALVSDKGARLMLFNIQYRQDRAVELIAIVLGHCVKFFGVYIYCLIYIYLFLFQ